MKNDVKNLALNQPSLIERVFLSFVSSHSSISGNVAFLEDRVDIVKKMLSIERGFMFRGALAGVLCGCFCALGVELAEPFWVDSPSTFTELIPYYSLSLGIGAIATLFEIAFLFWDGARSSINIGSLTGVLSEEENEHLEKMELSLLRAGLENPPPSDVWNGIDPLLGANRFRIIASAIIYKLKIAATSALIKGLFRKIVVRLSGRAISRSVVELVAIPVFALWNLFICRKVMREARLRALGPYLVEEIYSVVFPNGFNSLSEALQQSCIIAIKDQIIATNRRHPNVARLGNKIFLNTDLDLTTIMAAEDVSSIASSLTASQQKWVFEFLLFICVLDGRICPKERRMLKKWASVMAVDFTHSEIRSYEYIKSFMENGSIKGVLTSDLLAIS